MSEDARQPSAEEKQKFLAEAAMLKAQAERHQAEALYFQVHAEETRMELRGSKIDAERKERDERENLAAFKYHHTYHFWNEVTDDSVAGCVGRLNIWDRLSPACPMEIIFSSPGGSIVDGFILYDYIQKMRRKGHVVTTSTLGYAASMAGILLQAGDVRIMAKESWMLIHEASFGAGGKLGDVEDRVAWIRRMCERIVEIFSDRASKKTGKDPAEIGRLIKKNWTRRDWWLSSAEALKHGFVDEVE